MHLSIRVCFSFVCSLHELGFPEAVILYPSLLCPWTGYFGVASLWGPFSPSQYASFVPGKF